MKKEYKYYRDLKCFDKPQLVEIHRGLVYGFDVSIYASTKYTWFQMWQIREGLENMVDVSVYADPKYTADQMYQILHGMRGKLDVSTYADTKYTWEQMATIRIALYNNENPTEALTKYTIENL